MCFYKTGSCWCILVRHWRMSDIGEQCHSLWSDLTIVSNIWYHINIQDHRIEVCNKDIDCMYVAFLGSALHHQSCCSPTWISLLPTVQSIFHRRKQSYSYHLIHIYTTYYVLITIFSYLNFTCPVVTSEVLRANPVIKSGREFFCEYWWFLFSHLDQQRTHQSCWYWRTTGTQQAGHQS